MSKTLRILFLEDIPHDAEIAIAILEAAGYRCEWERIDTREDFLNRLDASEYDLILADYALPSFDGLNAVQLFLERGLDIPFILVSGALGEEAAVEVLKAGASDFVLKNRLFRLPDVVERALGEKEVLRNGELVDAENNRLAVEVAAERARLTNIVATVPGVVWEAWGPPDESSQRISFVSNYVETMLGYSVAECISTPGFWLSILHEDDKEHMGLRADEDFARGFSTGPAEFRWIAKDGHALWVESNYVVVKNEEGLSIGLRGVSIDITDRKSLEQQLTFQALHDPLTKLANRTLFLDRVEHALSRIARKYAPIAVLFIDLDDFKSVNDSLGHAAGDELLILVTGRLQACLRPSDTPSRMGGDEFAILLEDLADADQASVIAERIRNVLCELFFVAGTEVSIGSSIGIAVTADGRETPTELLRNADVAMYVSKRGGKDRITVFENRAHDVVIKGILPEDPEEVFPGIATLLPVHG